MDDLNYDVIEDLSDVTDAELEAALNYIEGKYDAVLLPQYRPEIQAQQIDAI